jgi:hypothetical protein
MGIDTDMNTERHHFVLDSETFRRLKEGRKQHNISMSRIVRALVAEWDGELADNDPLRTYCMNGSHSNKTREARKVAAVFEQMRKQ